MEYRRLGNSGLKVSALSFGAWVTFSNQLDVGRAVEIMGSAYDNGVNFFDNAEVYAHGEAERIMGRALEQLAWPRDSYLVSSKVRFGSVQDPKPTQLGLSRKHVIEACDQALERLGVDYLDLYLCHRPDSEVPIKETVWAMSDLIQMGKVHYWGTSEWPADDLREAHALAKEWRLIAPTTEQTEYNLFHRERIEVEYLDLYNSLGLGTTTFSPLASGVLTGKYNQGIPEGSRMKLPGYEWLLRSLNSEEGQARIAKVRELEAVAEELGISMAQLALAWCLRNPNVSTVITGATTSDQVKENLAALEAVTLLTDEVMERIEGVLAS
ncbi:MAG: aldo/keto reductase [Anaerolineae bacterium]|nr:MAG: aldo/keto reductase [Anaerolineae bacterium]